jgi:hypothetical protein
MDPAAQILHPQLVVHQREQGARIVVEDASGIAPVHAEDAEFSKSARSGEKPVHP